MRRRTTRDYAAAYAIAIASALATACGGGGGSSDGDMMGGSGYVATFLGSTPGVVAMAAGGPTASPDLFDVQVVLDNTNHELDKLFGAAFHITFDGSNAIFVSASGDGSVLGPGADYRAALVGVNEVAVSASLTGNGAGLDDPNGLLITLTFRAADVTNGDAYAFLPTLSRSITLCPTAGMACTDVTLLASDWTGGTLTVGQQ